MRLAQRVLLLVLGQGGAGLLEHVVSVCIALSPLVLRAGSFFLLLRDQRRIVDLLLFQLFLLSVHLSATLDSAFILQALNRRFLVSSDGKLAQHQAVASVSAHKTRKDNFFAARQHKSDRVWEDQKRGFFLDKSDRFIRYPDFRAVSENCLVVER